MSLMASAPCDTDLRATCDPGVTTREGRQVR